MAELVYIDETGSVGRGAKNQSQLILVAVIVNETNVQPLGKAVRKLAVKHLGWVPDDFELHGYEIWSGVNYWSDKEYSELIAAYDDALDLLELFDLKIAHSTIDKHLLHERYNGAADSNAYRLALQFLLEKVDSVGQQMKIVVADEAKEEELRAIKMLADLQEWGGGEVPGSRLKTVIDSLHFVQSHASPGVQMADLVAFIIQRHRQGPHKHPQAQEALSRLREKISSKSVTWRQPWPRSV